MESNLSALSLNHEDSPVYIQPHYKESYRLAIYALLRGGKEAYEEFLRAEQIRHFLSEEEISFILENAELPVEEENSTERQVTEEIYPSTYFPIESDEEVPDLDLGWPEVTLEGLDTSISLLFHPPRQNTPTIKEVIRKQIQEARQMIAIAMDIFTDVDIFKEIINVALKGVVVYIVLDDSQFKSFYNMSHKMGVNIQDIKTIRVRTVRGQQYQCQSGLRFHGSLEQKFILVDCRTVLYGTYSYTWSYEKIRLSMVLVITGQLACSYDEEFRRLYARSIVPELLSTCGQGLRDNVSLLSSSHLSIHQINMRSRAMPSMRSAQDDRFNTASMLTRGLSMQERLNQSHYVTEMGNLVRGHSYGGDLQRLNSMSRLRMGAKDIGPLERTASALMLTNSLSQQHLRHRTLYGSDQNAIPFCSETSLNKWKIDTYLNDSNAPPDGSCDVLSPLTSPYGSHIGLNEHQSQLIHSRSRDVKSRLEEMRQNRLSQQDGINLKQSQESIRSMYSTLERPKLMTSLRGLDIRQSMAELEPYTQDSCSLEPANHKDSEPKMEAHLTDGHRSASHYDIKTILDRKTYDWHEPLSRTTSATDLDIKLNEPSLKYSQQPRGMVSLIEIPEEKEGSNTRVNSANSMKSSIPPESQHQDVHRESEDSTGYSSGSAAQREGDKSVSGETETNPRILNTSAGSQLVADSNGQTEKQQEENPFQRKNSLKLKVYSLLMSDEKKASKKEEKLLQRKASFKSQNPSGSNQSLRADNSWTPSAAEQTTKRGESPIMQNSVCSPSETEKHKSPFSFSRLSPQRSSKKKIIPAEEQELGSRSTLNDETPTVSPTRREKVYSRFEYFLSTDNIPLDKSTRTASMQPSDKDRSSYLNRSDYSMYQTQSNAQSADNKLGRFMQRVGNLIGKNK
ncbi:protein FAM83B-like [Thunnus maccoyii]|uniref:protein FAM83B-like n=1 Tax=Thunnus maccoyii TaxID=8240 RepID=UPI001C4A90F6|nr:protein FAM83B-like [Thunnus maccoyii]